MNYIEEARAASKAAEYSLVLSGLNERFHQYCPKVTTNFDFELEEALPELFVGASPSDLLAKWLAEPGAVMVIDDVINHMQVRGVYEDADIVLELRLRRVRNQVYLNGVRDLIGNLNVVGWLMSKMNMTSVSNQGILARQDDKNCKAMAAQMGVPEIGQLKLSKGAGMILALPPLVRLVGMMGQAADLSSDLRFGRVPEVQGEVNGIIEAYNRLTNGAFFSTQRLLTAAIHPQVYRVDEINYQYQDDRTDLAREYRRGLETLVNLMRVRSKEEARVEKLEKGEHELNLKLSELSRLQQDFSRLALAIAEEIKLLFEDLRHVL